MSGSGPRAIVCLAFGALVGVAGAERARAQNAPVDAPGAVLEPPREVNAPPESRYQLKPTRDGGYTYDGPTFGARIAPDGSVSFSTRHFSLPPDGPNPSSVGIDTVTPQDPISGRFPAPAPESRPGVRFDVTDEYLRLLGKDPARGEKVAFLAATFDLRMDMATQVRRTRQQAALNDLPARLDGIWRDPRLTDVERLHLLQTMWDDLATGPEGEPARAVIRGFAHNHLSAQDAALFP